MTTTRPAALRERVSSIVPPPRLLGIGTALPARRWRQADLAQLQRDLWGLRGAALDRWQRIVERCGVEWRSIAADPEELPRLSTAERMVRFESLAPPLAAHACTAALRSAGVGAAQVTDLVVVTCTGFAAPGIASGLVGAGGIGLSASVRPLQLGFMGCFGGVAALRTAGALAASDPDAVVLAVCVELCSLHLRSDTDPQNLVASALFSDGAAAVVVAGVGHDASGRAGAAGPRWSIGRGRCLTIPEGRDAMTWRITDAGFAMTLSRAVPSTIRDRVGGFLAGASPQPRSILPHPGGPGVLDAVEAALGGSVLADRVDPRGLRAARETLAECGNMSSATILFVLQRALDLGGPSPVELVAFGPGLTIDSIALRSAETGEAGVGDLDW